MTQTREKILSFGTFRLVPSRHQLFDGDRPLRIGSRAMGLLQLLVEHAGEDAQAADLRTCPIQGDIPSRSYSFTFSSD